jgi:hypothetical protein
MRGVHLCISVVLFVFITACGREKFLFDVDPQLTPQLNPPVAGQPLAEPVAVVKDPQGSTLMFAADEVVLRPRDDGELKSFLAKYGGVVLSDGSPRHAPEAGKPAPPSGTYLIRIDVQRSSLDDIGVSMDRTHLRGHYTFSSYEGARLVALVARERPTLSLSLNPALRPSGNFNETNIIEGLLPDGTVFNYADQPYTTATLDLKHTKLGIGVVRAWDYLVWKGIGFFGNKPWHRPVLAIVDGGFALDTTTGAPLNGNLDFEMGATPVQLGEDIFLSRVHNAGGTNPSRCSVSDPCPYHGTGVFSVAAAVPRNQFGSAGTGAEIVKPYLIRVNVALAFQVARAIEDAVLLRPPADVINLSYSVPCGEFCSVFYDFEPLKTAINFARGYNNAVVVAAAGNDAGQGNNFLDIIPCTLDGVLCVGAIDFTANHRSYSGSGSRVSIWAPDCIPTTPDPLSGGQINLRFCGTSASAPFVAGIVSLMKALNPDLDYDTTRQILQSTKLSSPDPLVVPGYVNALGAVMAVSPDLPPTITIVEPTVVQVPWGQVHFAAQVSDPQGTPGSLDGLTITWTSDRDGALCTGLDCNAVLNTVGAHMITATVRDLFGATNSAMISLQAIEVLPTVTIFAPQSGQTFPTAGLIELRGFATSPSETIPDANLIWNSSLKTTSIGTGHIYNKATLPPGQQTVTLTATGKHGQASAAVTVNVVSDDIPVPQILAPVRDPISDYASTDASGSVTLVGSAFDPVDGVETDPSLFSWSDDVSGFLGTGKSLPVTLTAGAGAGTCGPVIHVVTLTATNKAGKKATTSIRISAGLIC